MAQSSRPARPRATTIRSDRVDQLIQSARQSRDERMVGYRERSLAIHPWVCARCGRSFNRENLTELTVHHKDHNHDNNPSDGSNWENLCIYCHDNEHARHEEHAASSRVSVSLESSDSPATHNPFANLKELLTRKSN
ncbi:MAG: HNH nuclease family protein [Magnetococcales bacterium]|nr:HNH nuclease family protein [Magnetococcales bacterium]NGZ06055.1 HNH nuclease family protein [Magnetococcales bacterium]